jgi:hypothetical protein
MKRHSAPWLRCCALFLICAALLTGNPARAQQPLLDDVRTIAASGSPAAAEHDFDITVPGTYTVQLTDLGALLTPAAPLASVTLALTSADALVGTPLVGAGTLQFTAANPGSYRLHIVGAPGAIPGSGPVGVSVSNSTSQVLYSFSDVLAVPSQAVPNSTAVLDDQFQVAASGSFQVSLNDLAFPQALTTLTLALIAEGSATPVAILPDPNNGNAMQATVSLQAGTHYRIFAIGQSGSATGGLYSSIVTPQAGGTPAYVHSTPVGSVTPAGTTSLNAGTYSLTATDLAFPAALTQASAILVLTGQAVATAPAAGFSAPAGTAYQVFATATAATVGSYAIQIVPASGPAAFSLALAVSAPGAAATGYSYNTTLTSAAGYTLNLVDLMTPRPLVSAKAAAVQNGVILGSPLSAAGSQQINAAAGTVTVLAFAQGAANGGSVFDLNIADASGALLFDQPQPAGVPFTSQKLTIPSSGSYTATVNDLAFPAKFQDLALIVSRGGTVVGSIFAGGSLPPFQATAGNYYLSLLATPTSSAAAGTYALNVATAPPVPTVSLSASPTHVTAGDTVALTWTSTNSTTCTGSGGSWSGHWTGADAASGRANSPAVSAATTFTLTCDGPGGSASSSVNVTIDAPASKGGGGGALDLRSVLMLLATLVARMAVRRPTC